MHKNTKQKNFLVRKLQCDEPVWVDACIVAATRLASYHGQLPSVEPGIIS